MLTSASSSLVNLTVTGLLYTSYSLLLTLGYNLAPSTPRSPAVTVIANTFFSSQLF